LSVYLDTNVAMWLSLGHMKKLPRQAVRAMDSSPLLISPMVLLELEYLYELNKLVKPARSVLDQLQAQVGLKLSDVPFATVASAALYETWTRDPFDRIIVAHAKSDGYAKLVSSDTHIQRNYSMTIWD
jgi:PIN domain nuclease of toxin-antitoxin system